MSRAAQRVQQLVEDMAKRRQASSVRDTAMDETTGQRTGTDPFGDMTVPAAQPDTATGQEQEQPAAAPAEEEAMATKAKKAKKATKAQKAEAPQKKATKAQAKPAAAKKAPKHRFLFVNTEGALSAMLKGLRHAIASEQYGEAELPHAEKLVARLRARGIE